MTDFLPENDLERALVQATNDPAARPAFYRLLLDSELFVLGKAGGEAGASQPGGEIQITQIRHKDRIYHPVFSSLSRMQNYLQEHPSYFTMKGRDLFASARGAAFLLNPGSAYGKSLVPEEIADMLQPNPALQPGAHPEEILITQPAVYPAALADVLKKLFETRPEIEAAYLAQMAIGGRGEPPHPIVGIKLDGPWDPLAEAIHRVVTPLPQGTRLAAMPITEEETYKTIGEMLMRYQPFYTRKSKLH